MQIGDKIRQYRVLRNLSQRELGARFSPPLCQSAIADMERGRLRVRADRLHQFATILEVPLLLLLPEAPPMTEVLTTLARVTTMAPMSAA